MSGTDRFKKDAGDLHHPLIGSVVTPVPLSFERGSILSDAPMRINSLCVYTRFRILNRNYMLVRFRASQKHWYGNLPGGKHHR
jgi:hypothetical protein